MVTFYIFTQKLAGLPNNILQFTLKQHLCSYFDPSTAETFIYSWSLSAGQTPFVYKAYLHGKRDRGAKKPS